MSIFNIFKKQKEADLNQKRQWAMSVDHQRILTDSLELIQTTTNPKTFFSRYNLALKEAELLNDTTHLTILTEEKEDLFIEFFDRCYFSGKLPHVKDDIISQKDEIPPEAYDYFLSIK